MMMKMAGMAVLIVCIYFCCDNSCDGCSTIGTHGRHWILVVDHPAHLVIMLTMNYEEDKAKDVHCSHDGSICLIMIT